MHQTHPSLFVALLSVLVLAIQGPVQADPIYPELPDDPGALRLTPGEFVVHADGVTDDTAALQAAIDRVGVVRGGGVLLIPDGTYLLSDTVYVWPGVRLIGYGSARPVFRLAAETPGFQDGDDKYMLYFSGGRGREPGDPPRDGNPGTFYSALSNIDIEIEPGNTAAVAVRFHVAQHCYLAHMDIRLSDARAGLVDLGNLVEDVRIFGGQIAIDTHRSAPGWPIAVLDCTFEDQSVAAIRTHEAGLAVVRPTIRNAPAALVMASDLPDQVWISDARFENIVGSAVVISRPTSARTQVNLENIVCENVPVLASFGETGETTAGPGRRYVVDRFTHGLHLGGADSPRRITTTVEARPAESLPKPVATDVPSLPPPGSWVNVRTLGVVGDGTTDDTAALQAAIDTHRALYFPAGWYTITDTLILRPDTVLVGLHPGITVINAPNDTPAFSGSGAPVPLILTPPGGTNIITGLGVYAGERNPRAVAVHWQGGEHSLLDDVRFHGGHGTLIPDRQVPRLGDREHWNTQPASLLVTGGGVLKNIWTPNPHARSGLLISGTTTPGRLYAMSAEHHVDHEVIVENASNWRFFALQFEAEREESPNALPLQIDGCEDLLFANTFFYRVVSSFVPTPFAITAADSEGVRFRNVHVYSNSKVSYDSAVRDTDAGTEARDPDFAAFDLPAASPPFLPPTAPTDRVTKLADGFHNLAGAAAAPNGDPYFADARENRVYRWSHEHARLEHVRDLPERPEQLAFDRDGNLLVIAYEGEGTVLAFDPTRPDSPVQRLEPQPAAPRPGGTPILPVSHWEGDESFLLSATAEEPTHFVAPDGATFIPASEAFTRGDTTWGIKLTGLLRTFAVAPASPGRPFYVTNEHDLRTYAFDVRPDGTLTDPRLFAEEGGESVAVGPDGRVYLAAGQILVFDPDGRRVGVIHVPQRPTSLVFGGPDGRTLYIAARDSLYAVTLHD